MEKLIQNGLSSPQLQITRIFQRRKYLTIPRVAPEAPLKFHLNLVISRNTLTEMLYK